MNPFPRNFLLFAALLILAGCAGTATGKSSSVLASQAPTPTLQQTAPAGSPLVVIRYPAAVETDAQTTYRSDYLRTPIGGPQAGPAVLGPDAQSIADTAILKSNYFALSLYKELVERLPEHSVLLSPHSVELAEDGSLTSVPITRAEDAPSVLTVDFAAYSFPNPERMMGNVPLTFGDLISPLVVVRADHRAAAATQGVVFSSRALLAHAGGTGRDRVDVSLAGLQAGEFAAKAPELDFISYISRGRTEAVQTKALNTSARTNAAEAYPLEKIVLDREALAALATDNTVDPLEDVFSSIMADRIVGMLNKTDMTKAAMVNRAAAIAEFDPSLAALSLTGLPDDDFQARMRYTERLLEAEQRYLSVQSLRIFDGIHNGEMGAQIREMLQAEYEHLEERRKLARQQNTSTALAVLGAVAAGAVIASGSNGSNCNGNPNCFNRVNRQNAARSLGAGALISGAVYAASRAISLNQQSATIGANYLTSIVPALEEQIDVQVNLIDSSETITAIRFEDLREKLQELYANNQRAIDTIGTQCGYNHTSDQPVGVWLGVCENGVAAGPGVGVLRYDDGAAVEYYGYAVNGQPNGAGYMLRHSDVGSISLEGTFANGEPDGIIRVSQSGRADRLRRYSAGTDIGAAPAGSVVASPFISAIPEETAEPASADSTPVASLTLSTVRNG